jgi:DNA-binding CsgD family transcriptional regulator
MSTGVGIHGITLRNDELRVARAPVCPVAELLARSRKTWLAGRLETGIDHARSAYRATCGTCVEPCTDYAGLWLAMLYSQIRRVEQAARALDAVGDSAARRGDRPLAVSSTLVRAKVAAAAGCFDTAAAFAVDGLRDADEVGLKSWTPLGNFVIALTAVRQGDLATALRFAQRVEEDAVFGRKMLPPGQAAWAILQITEVHKGRDTVAPLAAELLDSGHVTRQLLISEPAAAPWLVRLMLKCGERGLAHEGVRASRRLAAANPGVRSTTAAALHAVALYEADAEKLAGAADLHVDRWARASAVEDLGALLSGRKADRERAAENLDSARGVYAEIGALRDAARVNSRLRRIDSIVPAQGRGLPESGVAGLTRTEYVIAKLVAGGLTNGQAAEQLYLSRHTVAFHLRKIFRKLGVASRVQLARLWDELDTGGGLEPEAAA